MHGKLLIIEAGDGCGKATQTKALAERLRGEGRRVRRVEFPDYQSDSSALIKMYLNGDFGKHPDDVNAYAASAFYAVDRYASYRAKWKGWYESGGIVVADRYTTSNMAHQAVKIEDSGARAAYLAWLRDFEYVKLGLPEPDRVLFLEMPPKLSARLIAERGTKDIHELDLPYLEKCHRAYCDLAQACGWTTIRCADGGALKSPEQIHEDIYRAVYPLLD